MRRAGWVTASLTTKGWRTRPPLIVDSGNCSPGSVSNLRLRCHTQVEIVVPPVLATTLNLSGGHRATDRLPTVAEPLEAAHVAGTANSWVTSAGIAPSLAEGVVANHTGLSNHNPLPGLVLEWTEHECPDPLESDEISACDNNVHGRLLHCIAFWQNIDFVLRII